MINEAEPVKKISLESSADGTIFSPFATFASGTKDYDYEPGIDEAVIFRLKVTFVTGHAAYSNTIIINPAKTYRQLFTATTRVHSDIKITAPENYNYQLADINGRIIKFGEDRSGVKNINIDQYPNGIYTLQLISNSQRTTKRILKL